MATRNFPDLDQYAKDRVLRDRIRRVIRGLEYDHAMPRYCRIWLEGTVAGLQPAKTGANISRLEVGTNIHWENRLHSKLNNKAACALVVLRQLIVNYWDYLLGGTDESLRSDGQLENHLETLEEYVDNGLEHYVVVGDDRHGFYLMGVGEYRSAMEGVR